MKSIDFNFLATLRVLYVEDEVGIREKMALNLEDIFADLVFATNGEDGLEQFLESNSSFDLIISDIRMPKKDGLSMVDEIRKSSSVPVIVTTAFNEIDYLHKSISVGVSEYILKPINIKELLKLIIKNLKKDISESSQKVGDFVYYPNRGELYRAEEQVILTLQEKKFVSLLLQRLNGTLSYETLQNELWEEYVPESTVRSLARRVRKKFPLIETVSGVGYRVKL